MARAIFITARIATFLLVTVAATAQADALTDELAVCRDLPSTVEARLICYDNAVDRNKPQARTSPPTSSTPQPAPAAEAPAAPAPAPAAAATTSIAPAPELSQEELFGKSGDEVQQAAEEVSGTARIESLSATVAKLQKSGNGKIVVTLDNGQTWRQSDTTDLRLRAGDEIRIRRALLGSYMMQKVGSKRSMRVKRSN